MNRAELQQLSQERIDDARHLLAIGRWPGAYYIAGYALECALKSCVLAYIERTGVIFDDRKYAERCWTHEIEILVKQAGLNVERDKVAGTNVDIAKNWLVATAWTEASRYQMTTQLDAQNLIDALTDANNGVLTWVKNYW